MRKGVVFPNWIATSRYRNGKAGFHGKLDGQTAIKMVLMKSTLGMQRRLRFKICDFLEGDFWPGVRLNHFGKLLVGRPVCELVL
jgi:hypothetical protein